MSLTRMMAVVGGLTALALTGCGVPETSTKDYGDITGVEEIGQPLPALTGTVYYDAGVLHVTLASAELVVVSKHAVSGAILLNDRASGATSTSLKTMAITGVAGAETIILDFANGTFAPGTLTGAGIVVTGGGGADVFKIRGQGAAADAIYLGGTAQAANINLAADAYKDITVTNGANVAMTFSLGGGNDVFTATGTANGVVSTYTGALTIYGGVGNDTITGGDGADTIYGDIGDDTMNGGTNTAGIDTYYGGLGADAGAGADTVTYAARSAAVFVRMIAYEDGGTAPVSGEAAESDKIEPDVEVVIGGSGDDSFLGDIGNQTFYGMAGNDTFDMGAGTTGGAGSDTVYGGAGTDVVSYATRVVAVVATMDLNVANDGEALEADNVRDDVENFICPTGAYACTVTGNALDNTITCGAGDDTHIGGLGDDTFVEGAFATLGAGNDSFTGGTGIDTVDFATFGAGTNVWTMSGVATSAKTIALDVENLTCPTATACTVTGNVSNNKIVGSSAVDTINAGAGDDNIETVGGTDVVDCGDGSDFVYSAAGTPVLTACEL